MATRHDLMARMAFHIGKGHGIKCADLANLMGITERQVRQLVSEEREEGTAICGTPATGYYVAANTQELEETLTFLKNRAMTSLHLHSRLSKIPLPDLLGQLHLET
jgi:transposase